MRYMDIDTRSFAIVSVFLMALSFMIFASRVSQLSGKLVEDGVLVERNDSTLTLVIPDKRQGLWETGEE